MLLTKSRNLWQLIFILCILYSVSSMNVLIIFSSILPYLSPGFYLETMVLRYFSLISFALAALVGTYHLFIAFSKEEKDNKFEPGMKWKNYISKAISILIIIYAVVSVYTLFWGVLDVLPALPNTDIGVMWVCYSIISFAVVTIIAVFYFSVNFLMERKKRKEAEAR